MSRNHEHIQLVKREHSPSTGFYLPVYKLDMAEDDEPNTLGRTFIRPVVPALGVGTATGILGAAYGGVAGTLIVTPRPLLYTTISGVQWFCAGTTYFYCRRVLLGDPKSRHGSLELVAASGLAGSCAGAVAGSFLRRGAVIPGTMIFGALAAVSQAGLNTTGGFFKFDFKQFPSRLQQGIAGLVPMKSLSDKEYGDMLLHRLLKIEAEISILDDQIADLRAASKQQMPDRIQQPQQKSKDTSS
ncbi:hypothetical protein, variant [Exophiala xenobiotica]|uniref:Uncharacterized protein n=1 Tax=Exophiala xenobiotica TaxID=348802 RepID=A0A0D2C5P3_9EURO|nr:hypothetical protein, variant [Exophiala xenobiotica]XP_013320821.1 uncharacterized protein PV05_00469 [Exophiala xenobiotica]KIW60236.1 hypothetical protein PV05_00469 [Exophiala xenobiotica]KIW60237.1 hypothetical protein, variant [Exophiala xenobiotica]